MVNTPIKKKIVNTYDKIWEVPCEINLRESKIVDELIHLFCLKHVKF